MSGADSISENVKELPAAAAMQADLGEGASPSDSGDRTRSKVSAIKLLRRYPLLWFAATLIAGGQLATLLQPSTIAPRVILVLMLVCGAAAWWALRRHAHGLFAGVAVLTCFLLGVFCGIRDLPVPGDDLSSSATRQSQPIAVRAVIESAAIWKPNTNYRPQDPSSQPWRTQWQVACTAVRDGSQWVDIHARSTLAVEGRVTDFLPGDQIEVFGSYRAIYGATNPGAFDLAEHSRIDSRFVLLSTDTSEQMQLLGTDWRYLVPRLRAIAVKAVDHNLQKWVTRDKAPLAAALVFGQRQQVDWEEQQELMATGTLHMLAISGMHVEIVAWGVITLCLLVSLRDRWRCILVVSVCCLYAGLAEGKPPVLRAVVIVSAYELSRLLGRRARLTNLLSLAAVLLFLIRSSNLHNVGVHLSFLAVASIGVFVLDREAMQGVTPFERVLRDSAGWFGYYSRVAASWLVGMLRLSFWVWLITCPLVWANFHVVAPLAIPLNVLVAPPLCVSLLAGLTTGTLGWIPLVGYWVGPICGNSLNLITAMIEWGKAIPGGHYWLPAPPLWWHAGFYGGLVIWLAIFRRRRRTLLAIILVAWVAGGVGWCGSQRKYASNDPSPKLVVTFLDVGHGTSVLIEPPNGEVWLYDAGQLGAAERSHQEIAAALWRIGTSHIDTLVLSHADADHYNAVSGLVDRFSVGRVASTPQFWASQDPAVRQLINDLYLEGLVLDTWTAGQGQAADGFKWHVVHPEANAKLESDNASSLCLLLEFGGKRVLLPGDLDGTGLLDLTQLPERPCHVLMAPHHGSLTQSPSLLLEWCRPDRIVISGNHRAIRPAVLEEYAVAPTFVTFRDGAVQFRLSDAGEIATLVWSGDEWDEVQ